jgi:hypothetical protein
MRDQKFAERSAVIAGGTTVEKRSKTSVSLTNKVN